MRSARPPCLWLACVGLFACGAAQHAPDSTNADADADTIQDADDLCPLEPEDLDGHHDEDGCPDDDDDGDAILDVDDLCPCDAEDRDGFEDTDGCPDPDNDHDRIVDACDLCPNEPETYNGGCDEDGCPDTGGICVERSRIQIIEYVYFGQNRAEIAPESLPLLDAIAGVMNGNPQLTLVAVLGQTEPHERQREALARERAEAVIDALVSRGTARERLVAEVGTGAAVATLSPERQRRVELAVRIIDGELQPLTPEGEPIPETDGRCVRAACVVAVCTPTVTPSAC